VQTRPQDDTTGENTDEITDGTTDEITDETADEIVTYKTMCRRDHRREH
jgi:hypothetical protein